MEARNIVVGVDFSEESYSATLEAAAIARTNNARLTLVHMGATPADANTALPAKTKWQQEWAAQAEENRAQLDLLRARVEALDVAVTTLLRDDHPVEGLCDAAAKSRADLVVVGTHGRTGVKRFLIGSVTERVVRAHDGSVLVARGPASQRYERILVPTDFSDHARRALVAATSMITHGGRIDLVHFWSPRFLFAGSPAAGFGRTVPAERAAIDGWGEQLVRDYASPRFDLSFRAIERAPARGIVELAELEDSRYDLIAMGSRGSSGLSRFLLGSIAERTVRHAPCSVMVAHVDA